MAYVIAGQVVMLLGLTFMSDREKKQIRDTTGDDYAVTYVAVATLVLMWPILVIPFVNTLIRR